MKDTTRREFLKFGLAGMAGAAVALNFPVLGRRLALAGPDSHFFTVAVISDTQNYVDATHPQPFNKNIFLDQTRYLAENRRGLKLSFVTHVGDVVQHGDGTNVKFPARYGARRDIEWLYAMEAMDVLDGAGIPFGMCIGNHDYDNYGALLDRPLVSTPGGWNKYFGPGSKYFRGKPWYGGASEDTGYISTGMGTAGDYPPGGTPCNFGLSSYQLFSGAGRKFLHISLELEAGPKALRWAQHVLDSHRAFATIVTTHSFIKPPGWGENYPPLDPGHPAGRNFPYYLIESPSGYNSADSLWKKLIAPNDQIFLVLCGHYYDGARSVPTPSGEVRGVSKGENLRIDRNEAGHPVYQVLSDYQGNTTLGSGGGDGWYRFMQFDMESKNIHFYTLNAYETMKTGRRVLAGKTSLYSDGASDFDQPGGFSDFSLPMPVQVLESARDGLV